MNLYFPCSIDGSVISMNLHSPMTTWSVAKQLVQLHGESGFTPNATSRELLVDDSSNIGLPLLSSVLQDRGEWQQLFLARAMRPPRFVDAEREKFAKGISEMKGPRASSRASDDGREDGPPLQPPAPEPADRIAQEELDIMRRLDDASDGDTVAVEESPGSSPGESDVDDSSAEPSGDEAPAARATGWWCARLLAPALPSRSDGASGGCSP